jgi:hypothetical protein
VPIWFHWDGRQIILGTPARAPKVKILTANPRVTVTIDTGEFPYKVLQVRGAATVQVLDAIVPEYTLMSRRIMGPGADAWLQQVQQMLTAMGGMARVAITPEWVGILDFERRFPSAIARAMAGGAA